jgi:diguanylate cyclase (GGDEF)-like protein
MSRTIGRGAKATGAVTGWDSSTAGQLGSPADDPVAHPISSHDLQSAVAQLDQAIYNHEQWHKNLVRVLVSRLPADAADLEPDADRRCRFGQWYDSNAVGVLRGLASFVALGEAHRRMHASATLLLQRVEDDLPIPPSELDQFNNVLDSMRLELESLRRELQDAVQNRDPLTDARSRASMLADLREQHALVRRGLQECTLVMIDLDHFKKVNDTYGHATGDEVLKAVAHGLQANLRPYDRLYRYGGEEFVLCAPQSTLVDIAGLAERLRAVVSALAVPDGAGGQVQVTASFGVAALDGTQPVEVSLQRADVALYRAKTVGRDCVEVFTPAPDG